MLFGYYIIVEGYFKESIRAEYHTKCHEAQKCRHSKFTGKTICYDTGEDDGTAEKKHDGHKFVLSLYLGLHEEDCKSSLC